MKKGSLLKTILIAAATITTIGILVSCARTAISNKEIESEKIVQSSSENSFKRGYYYSKLSGKEQETYDIILKSIDSMPETIKVPAKLTEENLKRTLQAFECDNVYSPVTIRNNVYYHDEGTESTLTFEYFLSKSEFMNNKKQIEKKAQEIISAMPSGLDDYEKELYIHDYLVLNTKYKFEADMNENSVYGALINKESACTGYSRAFKYILDKLNIECITVSGISTNSQETMSHMWNQVKIDGEWYNVDVTWDDPVGMDEFLTRKYFNVRDVELNLNHTPEKRAYRCDSTAANFFEKENLIFEKYDEKIVDIIYSKMCNIDSKEPIEIMFTSSQEFEKACKNLSITDLYKCIKKLEKNYGVKVDMKNTGVYREEDINMLQVIIKFE